MELKKIEERLNKQVEEAKAKKQNIEDEVSKAKAELEQIKLDLQEALRNGDIETNNKLLAKQTMLNDRIKFYEEYLKTGFITSITEEEAKAYTEDINKCVRERINAEYDSFYKSLTNLLNTAKTLDDFFTSASVLNGRIETASKSYHSREVSNKEYLFRDVTSELKAIMEREKFRNRAK